MERIFDLDIEKLPEGVYLATSDEVQGLAAQGRTVAETLEIARDVATKLAAARNEHGTARTRPSPSSRRKPGSILARTS